VDGVSFSIGRGEIVGLVGESGSGKSVTSLAILGLLERPSGRITRGSVEFEGKTISGVAESELCKLRGDRISMIFQDPLTSLNPYLTIEEQLAEVLEFHRDLVPAEARERCLELLTQVGIPDPGERLKQHPHQLSGGMRQRVCIAMALLCDPGLLIADEPTTMLDVTIQAQILELIRSLREARNTSILFITHDLGVISELCDRVLVMYAGRVVEQAPTAELLSRPLHPYTEALLESTPRLDAPRGGRLNPIPGLPPRLGAEPITACTFAPRCRYVRPACHEGEPALAPAEGGLRLRRCVAPVDEIGALPR
jgi:peptide/nickel transport system ATP-binding protein/oligopeptide transport system ATP-binding protein